MRTVKNLPNGIPKNTDLSKFPDSGIINETEVSEGTPVVEEIYGDVLSNLYKILRLTKVAANGNQDNEVNGYQLVEALRKFTNDLNDSEKQLSLTGTQFSVNVDLSIVPNKYFCFARAVEDYVGTTTYTFLGANGDALPFSAPLAFKSGDLVLLIIDTAGVRAYGLVPAATNNVVSEVYAPLGLPLAFNNSNKLWYQEEGIIMSDSPEVYDLQSAIRLAAADGTLLVYEMILVDGFVYCLVYVPGPQTYRIYRFAITNLAAPSLVSMSGASFPTGVDNRPNMYSDGTLLYLSHQTGNSANAYSISKFTFNHTTGTLISAGTITLDNQFANSTNCVVKNDNLFEFINGQLYRYNLTTGARTSLGNYPGNIGLLFNYLDNIYYLSGEVAKIWNLP
jgi:hypothetical protein